MQVAVILVHVHHSQMGGGGGEGLNFKQNKIIKKKNECKMYKERHRVFKVL